jgi:Zn-dependent protease
MGTMRPLEDIIAILLSFVIAVTIHEFMHAWTAHKLGDNTARDLGRITLNPISHFEPFGFIGMVMISIGWFFIGWGKPVPVQPGRFKGRWARNRKHGMLLVTAAGPLSNVALALVFGGIHQIVIRNGIQLGELGNLLAWFVSINILLAAFNMIPVPPLDGYRILTGILPNFWTPVLRPLEQYGFLLLILLLFIGRGVGGGSVIAGMINPVRDALTRLVYAGLL